jgi:SAM-dependent methyltransferase
VRSDPEGWSAVCHRGAPLYFNRFIDWSQRRAVERLFRLVEFQPGDPAADIGCGTGRWAKELATRGLAARGFDISPAMVERARELAPQISFDVAPATDLPLPTASQKVVTCITVLHHLSYEQQSSAAAELSRVLLPGGACVIAVLLDRLPGGRWCYPRSRSGWELLFAEHGLQAIEHRAEEFLTPAILLQWVGAGLAALRHGSSTASTSGVGSGPGAAAALYRAFHRLAVLVSYPIEALLSERWSQGPSTGVASLYVKELT